MKKRIRADEAFERALQGNLPEAPEQFARMAKLAEALGRSAQPSTGPDPRFRARLRSEMLAAAAHQASEEEDLFAALLEGESVEAPAELRQLAKVASAMELPAGPQPEPAFRYQLRNKLIEAAVPPRSMLARASDSLVAWNTRMRRNLRVVGAMGLAVMMMLGASASFAASRDALPGDFLYPLKRFQESAQMLGSTGGARGEKLLHQARVRLGEVNALLDRGETDTRLFVDTLNDMDDVTVEGRDLLLDDYQRTKEVEGLRLLEAFAREQAADLTVIVDRLPPGARPVALDSLTLVDSIAQHTREALTLACSVCPSGFVEAADLPPGASIQDLRAECACRQAASPGGSTGSGPAQPDADPDDDGSTPNDEDPAVEDDEPTLDVPDLPDDGDEELEDLIDDLVDQIPTLSPSPSPLPDPLGL